MGNLAHSGSAHKIDLEGGRSESGSAHNARYGKGRSRGFDPPAQLDTVGIAFAIQEEFDCVGVTHTIVNSGTAEEQHRFNRKLPGGGFIGMGVGGMCWAEASLPKRVDGQNWQAVGLGQALELVAELHREACEFVEPDRVRDGHRVEASKVVRLDLVRDFEGVRSLGFVLDGLAGSQQRGGWKVARHADPERARAETLAVGPKSWRCTLYDKHAESPEAPPGQLRFESRLHAEQLRSAGARDHGGHVRVLADLGEDKLQSLRRWKFEQVGFDREVVAVGRVQELVFSPLLPGSKRDQHGLTKAEQRALWAYLTAGARGVDIGMSHNTAGKYRGIARRLGITMAAGELLDEGRITLRLDYDRGQEVLTAA